MKKILDTRIIALKTCLLGLRKHRSGEIVSFFQIIP